MEQENRYSMMSIEAEKFLNGIKQNKKLTKKMIDIEFRDFLTDRGFLRYTKNVYLKVSNRNIIQNITFEYLSAGFTCVIAMQPLYIQDHNDVSTFLHLAFGSRIGSFKVFKTDFWPYDEYNEGVADIKKLLIKHGLPWFERYGTPEGITEFIASGKVKEYRLLSFNEFFQKQYLGFCLLYLGQIDKGLQSLQSMIGEISENASGFMIEYKHQIVKLIDALKNHPDDVTNILNDIIIKNRIAITDLEKVIRNE